MNCTVQNGYAYRFLILIIAAVPLFPRPAFSQRIQEITIDVNTAVLQKYIPFDEPFLVKGEMPNDVIDLSLELQIYKLHDISVKIGEPRTYKATLFHPDPKEEKTKFEFLVDAVPPDRTVMFKLSFTKRVTSLAGFTAIVKTKIHELNQKFAALRVGSFTNAEFASLQSDLVSLFKKEYSKYEVKFDNTILGDGATAYGKLTTLQTHLVNSVNSSSTIQGNREGIKDLLRDIRTAPHIQGFYQAAVNAKRQEAANALSQVIALIDAEALAVMTGLTSIDESHTGAVGEIVAAAVTEDMSDTDALAARDRIEKSRRSLMNARAFVETQVKQNRSLQNALIGTKPSRRAMQDYTLEIDEISEKLMLAAEGLRGQATEFRNLADASKQYKSKMEEFMSEFKFSLENSTVLSGSSSNTFETRGSWYISADVGIVAVPEIKQIQPYYGAIIYFAPVNKNCSYSRSDIRRIYKTTDNREITKIWMAKHVGVTIGVTTKSIKDAENGIDDLWGSTNLMVGGGIRLGRALRLTTGGILFRGYKDGNMLNNEKRVTISPYISVSVDVDLLKFFGNVGKALFP